MSETGHHPATTDEPGTELKVALRHDITEAAIRYHHAMRRVNTCEPGKGLERRLNELVEETSEQLHIAVDRLDLLARIMGEK